MKTSSRRSIQSRKPAEEAPASRPKPPRSHATDSVSVAVRAPPRRTSMDSGCGRLRPGLFLAWDGRPDCKILQILHRLFEYAGQHCSRCAWICVCRLERCTAPTCRRAPLKSAGVYPSTARAVLPLVRRVSNDWRPVTVDRCRSSANGRESLVGPG